MTEEIWIIDDDDSIRWVLERALARLGPQLRSFSRADPALAELERGAEPACILADIRMPGMDGLSFLGRVRERPDPPPVVIMTAFSDLDSAVSAYQTGAFDYLPKPFDIEQAIALVERALQGRTDEATDGDDAPKPATASGLIGEAPAMQEVFRAIGRLSHSNITVLVHGESGTGKELVARALHQHSRRARGPLVAINTAAIPKDLLESELFGHEKGAFTGANQSRKGRFEQADGGTLFLDEIGDMPYDLQTRLLRVLADGSFYRVGGHSTVTVDVRIIAATHQNLEDRVRRGLFREDLYHRLNVIRIDVPPLRERREDIALLARSFMERVAKELGVAPKELHPSVIEALRAQDWPGNVRQLENTCRWLTVMATGREVFVDDLPHGMLRESDQLRSEHAQPPANVTPATSAYAGASDADSGSPTESIAGPDETRSSRAPKTSDTPKSAADWATAESPDRAWTRALEQRAQAYWQSGRKDLLEVIGPVFERTIIVQALTRTGGHRQRAAALLGWGRNTLTRKIQELELDLADELDE